MKVYWSDEARQRLHEIKRYIAQDSPTAAEDMVARLVRRSRTLEEPPLLGRRLPEFPESELREVLERPYRLIYMLSARGVEIVTLMHYRQILPSDMAAMRREPDA